MRFPGGGQLFITKAMPLDLVISFAMVVFFFDDWIPHDYYSYAENLWGVLVVFRSLSFFFVRHFGEVLWDAVWDYVLTQA
jgi:hypothetical protein